MVSLCLRFLICKMELTVAPTSQTCFEVYTPFRVLELHLESSQYSIDITYCYKRGSHNNHNRKHLFFFSSLLGYLT